MKGFVVVIFNHFSFPYTPPYIPFVVWKIRFERRASVNKHLFWTALWTTCKRQYSFSTLYRTFNISKNTSMAPFVYYLWYIFEFIFYSTINILRNGVRFRCHLRFKQARKKNKKTIQTLNLHHVCTTFHMTCPMLIIDWTIWTLAICSSQSKSKYTCKNFFLEIWCCWVLESYRVIQYLQC